jgi:hypothetical protein
MEYGSKEWFNTQMKQQGEAYKNLFETKAMDKIDKFSVLIDLLESEIGQYSSHFNIDSVEQSCNGLDKHQTFFEVKVSTHRPKRTKTLNFIVDSEQTISVDMYDDNWEVVEGQWGEVKYLWMALLSWEI